MNIVVVRLVGFLLLFSFLSPTLARTYSLAPFFTQKKPLLVPQKKSVAAQKKPLLLFQKKPVAVQKKPLLVPQKKPVAVQKKPLLVPQKKPVAVQKKPLLVPQKKPVAVQKKPLLLFQKKSVAVQKKPLLVPQKKPVAVQKKPLLVPQKTPVVVPTTPSPLPQKTPPPPKINYFSRLNPYNQAVAQCGGLNRLFSQDLLGQGQTVAVIGFVGTWKKLRDAIDGTRGTLSPEMRAAYKNNFLPPITGPKLDPNLENVWTRTYDPYSSGSYAASSILTFSPQAKVLPVSVGYGPNSGLSYTLSNALMDLAQRKDVNLINIACLSLESQFFTYREPHKKTSYKTICTPALIDAFKAVAKAGKAIVIDAGNDVQELSQPHTEELRWSRPPFLIDMLKKLDPQTRKAIIIAGSVHYETRMAPPSSTRPGRLLAAQKTFLFSPGKSQTSFSGEEIYETAAPFISSTLACLLSKSKEVTPQQAVQALLTSAQKTPEVETYGQGIIRADQALELLSGKRGESTTESPSYFSRLNSHNQLSAQSAELDDLFAQNLYGQGQTIALIEYAGTWQAMQNTINGSQGELPTDIRESYKNNFLAPIGGPGADPNLSNKWTQSIENHSHGSLVASGVLGFAPQAKVLPVSTYCDPDSKKSYTSADALMDLAKRKDVHIINLTGHICDNDVLAHPDGTWTVNISDKLIDAVKEVVKAGKVIVIPSANEGQNLSELIAPSHKPPFAPMHSFYWKLWKKLDSETKKSIIIAGNIDPETRNICPASNKAGTLKDIQKNFLCAPGKLKVSYSGIISDGTSHSGPFIAATLACLLSKSKSITPQKAASALLESAEEHPDAATYGRGIIRARRALRILEDELK